MSSWAAWTRLWYIPGGPSKYYNMVWHILEYLLILWDKMGYKLPQCFRYSFDFETPWSSIKGRGYPPLSHHSAEKKGKTRYHKMSWKHKHYECDLLKSCLIVWNVCEIRTVVHSKRDAQRCTPAWITIVTWLCKRDAQRCTLARIAKLTLDYLCNKMPNGVPPLE